METQEFTRKELIQDIHNHTASDMYCDESNEFKPDPEYAVEELHKRSNEELIEIMMEHCSWYNEVTIKII